MERIKTGSIELPGGKSPGHTPVAVTERVEFHKAQMKHGRRENRRQLFGPGIEPTRQIPHKTVDLFARRAHMQACPHWAHYRALRLFSIALVT